MNLKRNKIKEQVCKNETKTKIQQKTVMEGNSKYRIRAYFLCKTTND